MNDRQQQPARMWLRPVAIWLTLVLLALAGLRAAYLPLHTTSAVLHVAIPAIMIILLWLFLMDLIGSGALVRLIAVAGLLWLSFMFALTFSDYLFRACETPDGGKSALCVVQHIERHVF